MGNLDKFFSDALSTEGVTKKDGQHVKTKKRAVGYTTSEFHNKVIEARIKQSNRKWLVKEITLGIIGVIVAWLIITSK